MNVFQMWMRKMLSRRMGSSPSSNQENSNTRALAWGLQSNVEYLAGKLGNSSDLVIRTFRMGESRPQDAAVLYIEGMADHKTVLESLMTVLHEQAKQEVFWPKADAEDFIRRLILPVGNIRKETDLNRVLYAVLSGEMAILFDGVPYAVMAGARKLKERSVQEPDAEPVVRGPRDGFTENLRTNTSLIRRRIKDPNLWMETLQAGRMSHTDIAFMYLKGLALPEVVDEVRSRLQAIDVDSILESGYVEEFIQDRTFTVFPMLYSSERPDVISAEILEGRVAILVDGTPFVLAAPANFAQFMQAAEDHYQKWLFSSFIRIIRYICFFIALLAPALYIAITTFHHEILPPQLLMSLAAAREGVPFPAFVEAMVMEIIFEILREAGVRMPKTIGQAVSIVGTLVIGQAAVEAGLVSPAMVIVVSITAIANFVIPAYSLAISLRLLRFFMMVLAGSLGIFGILLGLFIVVFHLCSLRSFGVPYLNSFAPFSLSDQKDAILRLPRWLMFTRPSYIRNQNPHRIGSMPESAKKDAAGRPRGNS